MFADCVGSPRRQVDHVKSVVSEGGLGALDWEFDIGAYSFVAEGPEPAAGSKDTRVVVGIRDNLTSEGPKKTIKFPPRFGTVLVDEVGGTWGLKNNYSREASRLCCFTDFVEIPIMSLFESVAFLVKHAGDQAVNR